MDVVEVAARIGDSTIALVHLEGDQSFVIGSEPGCDLAVTGIGRFPLVAGDLVRIPAGVRATVDGAARAGEDPIVVELGLAVVTIRKLARAAVPVPRPRFELRMTMFLLASLLVQVALWAVAAIVAPYSEPVKPPRILPLHVAHPALPKPPEPAKPPPPEPKAEPKAQPQTSASRARSSHGRREATGSGPTTIAGAITELANMKGPVIELDGTGTGPESYEDYYYGHTLKFDPDSNPAYDSVKVGKLAIPSAGKGLGQTLPPPRLVFCDDDSCLARGGITLGAFVAELERHEKQIQDCYVDHTDQVEGTIRLRFGITRDGKAFSTQLTLAGNDAHARKTAVLGTGIGTVGRCVGKILDQVQWPKASVETEVWLGIAFLSGPAPASPSP